MNHFPLSPSYPIKPVLGRLRNALLHPVIVRSEPRRAVVAISVRGGFLHNSPLPTPPGAPDGRSRRIPVCRDSCSTWRSAGRKKITSSFCSHIPEGFFFIPALPQPARPWQQSPSVLCSTPPAHGEGLPRASFSQGASPSRVSGDFPALDNYSRAPEPAYFCPAAAQLGSEPAASLQLNYKQTKPFVTAAQRGLCLRFFP